MNRLPLGRSGLNASALCLGTMTWGTQNTPEEAFAQIDMALERGVNFLDTAEIYPTNPLSAERAGRTEEIIGAWNARSGRRGDILIATKVAGPNGKIVRDGAGFSPAVIREAVEGSLRRLRTDVIDLYQLHWPNRGSYHFRQNWRYDPSRQNRDETLAHMHEVLETLGALIAEGKLRAVGLSNETAWGSAQWLRLSEAHGLPRMHTIQNEYSLLCRLYDTDMAELGHNEDLMLLAYSPLATGLLSGKYAGDVIPEGSRRSFVADLGKRVTPRVWEAVSAYLGIAQKHGLDPVQMATAFVLQRPFPALPIIGATTLAQLETVLGAADLVLSDEVLAEIDRAHKAHPMPF